jgi:hypothetical protein
MDKYDLEELILIFSQHAIISELQYERDKKNYPDADHVKNPFNLPIALKSMCEEIKKLKLKA